LDLTLQKNCIVSFNEKISVEVQVAIIPYRSIFNSSPSLIRVTAISEPFFENEIKIFLYSNIGFSKKNIAFKKSTVKYYNSEVPMFGIYPSTPCAV